MTEILRDMLRQKGLPECYLDAAVQAAEDYEKRYPSKPRRTDKGRENVDKEAEAFAQRVAEMEAEDKS